MKLKQFTKYTTLQTLKNLAWFYAIYLAIFLVLGGLTFSFGGESGATVGGSISSGIFLFVMGIVLFGQNLRIGLANGVSRKTLSLGSVISVVLLSLVSAVVNLGFAEIWSLITGGAASAAQYTYAEYFANSGVVLGIVAMLLIDLCTNLICFAAGYFVGGGYYRMNKLAKVLVSVLVPVALIIGLPILVVYLPAGILQPLGRMVASVLSFIFSSPYNYSLVLLIGAALCGLFAWLLVRRAPLKTPQG